ncbi:MAG TPA: MerR family transcriptional regulator [Acidobacteriaceae bacterium]|jgi:DNA-binding transcriptional MerR regulator|nr:MerR family transcriptional regulator [Acidobacteriaceae bacterium]
MVHFSTVEPIDNDQPVTCKVSELSQVSGVKKQALRRYARIGLLHPAVRLDSGRPLYTRHDLIQLERLAIMQMLELSRSDIKERLSQKDRNLKSELRLQREILVEKRRRLNRVIYFLEYAEQVNRDPKSGDWHYLGRVVEAIQMLRDPEYFKQSYIHGYLQEEDAHGMHLEIPQRFGFSTECD